MKEMTMSIDTGLMWELPPGTPAWEDLTPEEQVSSIEALLAADYAAEQAQQLSLIHI